MSNKPTPPFVIYPVKDRSLTEKIYRRVVDEETKERTLVAEEVTRIIPNSFLVKFRAGHTLWFETKAQMEAAGVRENVEDDDDDFNVEQHITPSGSILDRLGA